MQQHNTGRSRTAEQAKLLRSGRSFTCAPVACLDAAVRLRQSGGGGEQSAQHTATQACAHAQRSRFAAERPRAAAHRVRLPRGARAAWRARVRPGRGCLSWIGANAASPTTASAPQRAGNAPRSCTRAEAHLPHRPGRGGAAASGSAGSATESSTAEVPTLEPSLVPKRFRIARLCTTGATSFREPSQTGGCRRSPDCRLYGARVSARLESRKQRRRTAVGLHLQQQSRARRRLAQP